MNEIIARVKDPNRSDLACIERSEQLPVFVLQFLSLV
jgi:hypothetical protein